MYVGWLLGFLFLYVCWLVIPVDCFLFLYVCWLVIRLLSTVSYSYMYVGWLLGSCRLFLILMHVGWLLGSCRLFLILICMLVGY